MINPEFLKDVKVVVVVPARGEPNCLAAVKSLYAVTNIDFNVLIILVLNAEASDSLEIKNLNSALFQEINRNFEWNNDNIQLKTILENDIPDKEAGVGFARKLGMDMAADILQENGNLDGIIVCFDADCKAPKGYLENIYEEMNTKNLQLAAINYEHVTDGLSEHHKSGILQYELFLRYYSLALRRSGYPFWHQTIGSSMAVRADTYLKMGGMNKRKAGEDFYFMHKLMPVCKTGTIYNKVNQLSPRISDRVPFGTGKTMEAWSRNKTGILYTYHPEIFRELQLFIGTFQSIQSVDLWLKDSKANLKNNLVNTYFNKINAWETVGLIYQNTTSTTEFKKRFFQWFNGFRVLKFVHWARDLYYMNIPVGMAVEELLAIENQTSFSNEKFESLLKIIFESDRNDT